MPNDIDSLHDGMVAAGVRIFVGGLQPAGSSTSLRLESNKEIAVSSGPYLKIAERVAEFWVLEVTDQDEALRLGRKAAIACRAPVEVRPVDGRS